MKKIVSLILSLAMCIGVTSALADGVENNANNSSISAPVVTSTQAPAATVVPVTSTQAPAATVVPVTSTQAPAVTEAPATPTPIPTPTLTPTPAPTPVSSFFYCMKNGVGLAYIKDDNGPTLKYEPMAASNGLVAKPDIVEGRTYLPFRYLFEEMLGFTCVESSVQLNEREYTFYNEDNGVFVLKYKINGEEKYIKDNEIFVYQGEIMPKLKVPEGAAYIPLRYFETEKLCKLDWKDNKYIVLADSQDTIDSYYEQVKTADGTINDNYVTYSDIIMDTSGNVFSIGEKYAGLKAYSASNILNLAVYSNNDQKVCYINLNDADVQEKVLEIDKNGEDEEYDIRVDKLVVYKDKIYGLKVSEENQYTGTLFTADLSAEIENGECKIIAENYTEIVNSNGVIMFDIEDKAGTILCYYVDSNDGYALKKLNLADGTVNNITVDGEELRNIDYFAVGKEHIAYYDFNSGNVKCGSFDGSNIMYVEPYPESMIQFISYDSANNRFFYVSTPEGANNKVKCIYLDENRNLAINENVWEAEKIRNISVIGSVTYAKVNGVAEKIAE